MAEITKITADDERQHNRKKSGLKLINYCTKFV